MFTFIINIGLRMPYLLTKIQDVILVSHYTSLDLQDYNKTRHIKVAGTSKFFKLVKDHYRIMSTATIKSLVGKTNSGMLNNTYLNNFDILNKV